MPDDDDDDGGFFGFLGTVDDRIKAILVKGKHDVADNLSAIKGLFVDDDDKPKDGKEYKNSTEFAKAVKEVVNDGVLSPEQKSALNGEIDEWADYNPDRPYEYNGDGGVLVLLDKIMHILDPDDD